MDTDQAPDADPIKATYDVFIKPQLSDGRQVYILQFPNRSQEENYSKANKVAPLELRIKPKVGMVELDVPLDNYRNYDVDKGIKWGGALKASKAAKGGGSHGLAGGFGIGGVLQPAKRSERVARLPFDVEKQRIIDDYAGAVTRHDVLTEQTLGGHTVLAEDTTPQYFVGAFRRGQLHLTPVNNIVQLRPQFHHIDALKEQEQNSKMKEKEAGPKSTEAKAIHMTVKSQIDGEEDRTDNMGTRINAAQAEGWRKHRFEDEDSQFAWTLFESALHAGPTEGDAKHDDLAEKVPHLTTGMSDMAYMDSISAPNDAAKLSRSKKMMKEVKQASRKGKEVMRDGDEAGEHMDVDM